MRVDADGVVTGPFVRSAYNYDRDTVSVNCGSLPGGRSLTQQEFKEEADINTIVRRFGLTGKLPDSPRLPVSGDFTGVGDYQSALNAVLEAEAQFMALPAQLRARFENDPQRLMTFMADDRNRDEAVKLGLVKAPPPPQEPAAAAAAPSPSP